jgi:hypothetical protein
MEGSLATVVERNLKNEESRAARLKQRLEELLREAANVEVELSRPTAAFVAYHTIQ